jgi:hypothetical protein
MANDVVNCNFNDIRKHPELQWMLLALCGTGKAHKHQWIAPGKGTKKKRDILEEEILLLKPLMNNDELELFLKINTKDDLEEFFSDYGYEKDKIKEIFKNTKLYR